MRIDIDTVRDARMLPVTLELLKRYGIKASFFVTTGVDETYRNFRHYTPWKLISGNAIRRYGPAMFTGLLTKKEVQLSEQLDMITEHGHELGLHGYDHYAWMNHLEDKSREEVRSWIARGCELFEKAFGFHPECFAVPGFRTGANYLEVLDDFGFRYASDFMGTGLFYPSLKGASFRTLQVPVSLAIGEHDDREAITLLERQMSGGYAVFYFHPSGEPIFRKILMEEALRRVAERAVPLGDLIK